MKKAIDYQKEKVAELLELIKENPDLPIAPMVDSEIVCDDSCGRWMGSFGGSHVGEYIMGEDKMYFRDDGDWGEIESLLSEVYGCGVFEEMDDATAEKIYREMPWIRAIIVAIDLPD